MPFFIRTVIAARYRKRGLRLRSPVAPRSATKLTASHAGFLSLTAASIKARQNLACNFGASLRQCETCRIR